MSLVCEFVRYINNYYHVSDALISNTTDRVNFVEEKQENLF